MNYDFNLAFCLAHTLLLESKEAHSPKGIVDDAHNGGDPAAPTPSESTAATMQAWIKYLPQLMATALPQMVPAAQAQLAAQQATSPATSQLQADMYSRIAPQLNATSQAIDASNKLAGSKADVAVLEGPGAEAARAATNIDRATNPEYYAGRTATGNTIDSLLSGGLTPAEEEAINRSLARQNFSMGVLGTPTATSTVSNAMQFGDAARQRQLQGVGAATSFLPVSRSGIDPTSVALGRPSINTGQSQFLGVNQNAGQSGLDTANNLFSQIAGFQQGAMNINANRRDTLDRVTGVMSSLPSYS